MSNFAFCSLFPIPFFIYDYFHTIAQPHTKQHYVIIIVCSFLLWPCKCIGACAPTTFVFVPWLSFFFSSLSSICNEMNFFDWIHLIFAQANNQITSKWEENKEKKSWKVITTASKWTNTDDDEIHIDACMLRFFLFCFKSWHINN